MAQMNVEPLTERVKKALPKNRHIGEKVKEHLGQGNKMNSLRRAAERRLSSGKEVPKGIAKQLPGNRPVTHPPNRPVNHPPNRPVAEVSERPKEAKVEEPKNVRERIMQHKSTRSRRA